jgi:hypothetical protein
MMLWAKGQKMTAVEQQTGLGKSSAVAGCWMLSLVVDLRRQGEWHVGAAGLMLMLWVVSVQASCREQRLECRLGAGAT